MSADIRWKQRFENYVRALALLEEAVCKYHQEGLSKLEEQGLIQRFEFTHELAWKVLKIFFEYQGITGITGSRDASLEAFNAGLIENGNTWMEMIISRNQSSHTYDDEVADQLTTRIVQQYFREFIDLKQKLLQRY